MIHFIVATIKEARPLIDFYKLKKKNSSSQFQIFLNQNISLTVSKIGKINSAISVCHTFFELGKKNNQIWINFGLAGIKNLNIGELILVDKVVDNDSNKQFFPYLIKDLKIKQKSCVTFSRQNEKLDKFLSDMECSGFFQSSSIFSSKELIHSIKMISDNEFESINFSNDQQIYNIVNERICDIDEFVNKIWKTWDEFYKKDHNLNYEIDKTIKKLKPTFYQKHKLTKLIRLYFDKYQKFDHNILDYKKNTEHNIKLLLKKISL